MDDEYGADGIDGHDDLFDDLDGADAPDPSGALTADNTPDSTPPAAVLPDFDSLTDEEFRQWLDLDGSESMDEQAALAAAHRRKREQEREELNAFAREELARMRARRAEQERQIEEHNAEMAQAARRQVEVDGNATDWGALSDEQFIQAMEFFDSGGSEWPTAQLHDDDLRKRAERALHGEAV